jgi:hypothetical protein
MLCHEVLAKDDDIVATSHFIADRNDPLWQFSDAGFHRRCFIHWEHRGEFVRRYNEVMAVHVWGNGKRHQMNSDGSITETEP